MKRTRRPVRVQGLPNGRVAPGGEPAALSPRSATEYNERATAMTMANPDGTSSDRPDASTEGPRTSHGLRVGTPPQTSGGIPAIASAMRHTMAEMGLVRGAKMLMKVNQADGFDCPGCAWPEPEEHRSAFEFCE